MEKDPLFTLMWEDLGKLGFRHREKYGNTFKQLYLQERNTDYLPDREHLAFVRKWLLVPYSFWPVDFSGLARYLCCEVASGRRLSTRVELTLSMLRRFPAKAAQRIIIEHENEVSLGEYGRFMRSSAKFEAFQKAKLAKFGARQTKITVRKNRLARTLVKIRSRKSVWRVLPGILAP